MRRRSLFRQRSLSLDSPNRKRVEMKSVPILTALPEIKPNVLLAISSES